MKIVLNKEEVREAVAIYVRCKLQKPESDEVQVEDIDLKGGYGTDYAVWEKREAGEEDKGVASSSKPEQVLTAN